jgi:ribosomal protein S18 acetylase RimI-like enzyme
VASVNATARVEFAIARDATPIAELSRDTIESGLGWTWRPQRVLASIRASNSNVVVIRVDTAVAAFGIMHYAASEAYLALLAVTPGQRRSGLGTRLLTWFEDTALVAGIGVIRLEARASNRVAREFYRANGYLEIEPLPGHYQGRVDGVRLAKDLWNGVVVP